MTNRPLVTDDAPASASGVSHPDATPEAAEHRKKRVMVVDDSKMTVALIAAELTGKGFEVVEAESVEAATRLLLRKATRPDLVLLDVNMPNVDGAQFCRFLKKNSLFAGIKVLLCSGVEPGRLEALARESGADGFVPKDAILSRWLLAEIEGKA